MNAILLMLLLVCSTLILCIILHHNHVFFFPCFHNKVPLKLMFCTFYVLIIGFCVPYLDLKLGLLFCYALFTSFGNLCVSHV